MSKNYHDSVAKISKAVQILHSMDNPNIAAFARDYNLPYQRLKRAYRGGQSRSTRPSTNKLLTEEQEAALKRFLDAIGDIGFGIHKSLIKQQTDALLAASHQDIGPPRRCGDHWAERWLQANPQYQKVKAKPLEIQRKLAQEPEVIKAWFKKLKAKIDELGVQPEDIYNMDETGCQIGVAKGSYVYTRLGKEVPVYTILYGKVPILIGS
jgi:hypothetical protein